MDPMTKMEVEKELTLGSVEKKKEPASGTC